MKYTCIFENYLSFEPQVCYRGPIQMKKKFGRKNRLGTPQKKCNENSLNYVEEETDVVGPPPHNTFILCRLYRKRLVVYKQKG